MAGDLVERVPVTTVEELDALNLDEIVEGFTDAYRGEPEPGDNRSRSYWHGYQNGIDDCTKRNRPEAGMLIDDMRRKGRLGPSVSGRSLHQTPSGGIK